MYYVLQCGRGSAVEGSERKVYLLKKIHDLFDTTKVEEDQGYVCRCASRSRRPVYAFPSITFFKKRDWIEWFTTTHVLLYPALGNSNIITWRNDHFTKQEPTIPVHYRVTKISSRLESQPPSLIRIGSSYTKVDAHLCWYPLRIMVSCCVFAQTWETHLLKCWFSFLWSCIERHSCVLPSIRTFYIPTCLCRLSWTRLSIQRIYCWTSAFCGDAGSCVLCCKSMLGTMSSRRRQ